jgi:hypothetical protein
MTARLRLSVATIWSDLTTVYGFLVLLLAAQAVVVSLLSGVGVPVKVGDIAVAAASLVALIIKDAITARTNGGLAGFLMAIAAAWALVATYLGQIGVPVKITTYIGAGLALAAFIVKEAIVAKLLAPTGAVPVPHGFVPHG